MRLYVRILSLGIWLTLILTTALLSYRYGDALDMNLIRSWSEDHLILAVLVFLAISSIRGLLLIPRTPLLLTSIAIFPAHLAYTVNIVSVLCSTMMVYFIVSRFDVASMMKLDQNQKFLKIQGVLRRRGLPIIAGWSFIPLVQTDLIVYAAAVLRIRLSLCLTGVLAGEGILNAIYVYGANAVLKQTLP